MDFTTIGQFALRWIHLIAGIIWIGLLYFFNFVNANVAKALDAETKKKVVPELMPRALFFFRWGAMITFLTGWVYLLWKLHLMAGTENADILGSSWFQWIILGAALGSVMWFNVWFIIWPAQKKIISAVKNGTPPDAALVGRATLASKINTYLSMPMLFCMGAASHLPVMNPLWLIIALVLGFGIAHHLFKVAPNVGKFNW